MSAEKSLETQTLLKIRSLALCEPQSRTQVLSNKRLFSNLKEKHLVELIGIEADASCNPMNITFRNARGLADYLHDNGHNSVARRCGIEIYFLHQQHTWAPLNASRDMISTLMDHYNISCGFLQMLTCFRARHLPTEEGSIAPPRMASGIEQFEFGWVYKYPEKKVVESGSPWVIRQTGVYHIFNTKIGRSTYIVLNPSINAKFKMDLQKVLQEQSFRSVLRLSGMLIHSMLMSSHLREWRDYLDYHESLLLKLDMKVDCTDLEDQLVSFDSLKEVRIIEKEILPVEPLLSAFDELVQDLQQVGSGLSVNNNEARGANSAVRQCLEEVRKEALSYKTRAVYLRKRAQLTAQTVLDSLNLEFQQLAKGQSQNTIEMARSSREDSIAIRAITLVTSFYLPFSFVAVSIRIQLSIRSDAERNADNVWDEPCRLRV